MPAPSGPRCSRPFIEGGPERGAGVGGGWGGTGHDDEGNGRATAPAQLAPPQKRAFPTRSTGRGGKRLLGLFPPHKVLLLGPPPAATQGSGMGTGMGRRGLDTPPGKGFCWSCNGSPGEAQHSFPSSISIPQVLGTWSAALACQPGAGCVSPSILGECVPRNLRAMPGPGQGWTELPRGPKSLAPAGLEPGSEHQPWEGRWWWRSAAPHTSAAPTSLQDGMASARTFLAPAAHGTHHV